MNCPKFRSGLRKITVKVWRAKSRVLSYQCPKCDYHEYDQISAKKVIQEIKENPFPNKKHILIELGD